MWHIFVHFHPLDFECEARSQIWAINASQRVAPLSVRKRLQLTPNHMPTLIDAAFPAKRSIEPCLIRHIAACFPSATVAGGNSDGLAEVVTKIRCGSEKRRSASTSSSPAPASLRSWTRNLGGRCSGESESRQRTAIKLHLRTFFIFMLSPRRLSREVGTTLQFQSWRRWAAWPGDGRLNVILVKVDFQVFRVGRNRSIDSYPSVDVRACRFDFLSWTIGFKRVHLVLDIDPEWRVRISTHDNTTRQLPPPAVGVLSPTSPPPPPFTIKCATARSV